MWRLITNKEIDELTEWLEAEPHMAYLRSKDGRGPMWWAFEQKNDAAMMLLMQAGVPHGDKDANGQTPHDLLQSRS